MPSSRVGALLVIVGHGGFRLCLSAVASEIDSSTRKVLVVVQEPALVAQRTRASDYGSEGWGFESLRARSLA